MPALMVRTANVDNEGRRWLHWSDGSRSADVPTSYEPELSLSGRVRSVTRGWRAGRLAPGFLDPAEEVEHPAGQECSGLRIVGRQRAVGEVVLITGVEEQLGVVDGRDDLPGRVNVSLPDEDRVRVHAVDLDGDSVGPRTEGPFAGDRDAGVEQQRS